MKITQTLELNEKERKVIQDFVCLMDNITDNITNRSVNDVAMYFLNNAEYNYDDGWKIDTLHQIKEI